MTAPGLVISTDTSTCVSISLILPHKMRSLYWLPNTISRDSIWKLTSHLNTRSLVNLGISFENRCPPPPPAEAQFPTHILTLSRMRGKLGKAWATSPQHRHRRTNRRRNSHKCSATCCWFCFCQSLKFEQNESIGCFSDVARYYNSEVINITHITTICVHLRSLGTQNQALTRSWCPPGPDIFFYYPSHPGSCKWPGSRTHYKGSSKKIDEI